MRKEGGGEIYRRVEVFFGSSLGGDGGSAVVGDGAGDNGEMR